MKYQAPFDLVPKTAGSAGLDLEALEDGVLPRKSRSLIPTQLFLELDPGQVGIIESRSGLALKGLDVGAGVIDSDYSGEVKVLLINTTKEDFRYQKGDRIAQLLILSHADYSKLEKTDQPLRQTARGAGGFGSTGLNDHT